MKDFGVDFSARRERHLGLWLTASALILASGLWLSGTGGRLAAALTHASVGVNRTLPNLAPPTPGLRFTANPVDAEFLHAGLFLEPLVPIRATTPAENRDLAKSILAYRDLARDGANRDALDPLLGFLAAHPDSAWKPALQLNIGIIYRQTGHFSKALAVWQDAWRDTQNLTDQNGRALGDATIARLTQFDAYLGRKEVLQPLLDEVRDRPVRGSASQVLTSSREGLFHMIARPDRSFRCGPSALSQILLHDNPTPAPGVMQVFEEARSTPNGMSLSAVQQVSVKAGMNYQMAYRTPGAQIITPAVAHWKVGHYAAIEPSETDRYIVEDPTFGETIRVSAATLDEESSGYFLVPKGALPPGWRSVPAAEGDTIWGRGDTGNNKDPGDSGPPPSCPTDGGCTTWTVAPMVVGLELHDAPVGYLPPLGPAVMFDLYYSHRDVLQPQTFSYINFGPKWTFTWLSYVTDNVTSSASATLYGRGGGSEPFTFNSTSSIGSELGPFSQSTLTRSVGPGGVSSGFTRRLRDGSSEQFNLAVGNQFFMTAVVDKLGNRVGIHYDSQMRIVALTDAIGQVSTLTYGLATDPLKVTKITDPFGRAATFTYNANGQLASITDTLGITSSYVYGTADFISSLTTPYGTTAFSYGDATTNPNLGDTVFLKVTDPLKRTSYIEFNQTTTPVDANGPAPTGMSTCICYLEYRNTFIFDPNQYQLATAAGGLDYSKAHLIHWLHTSDLSSTSRVMESEKQPLENRVWYNYPGQPSSIQFGTSISGVSAPGSISLPTAVGRVLDNGTTQLQTYAYNAYGNPTQSTDPVGRRMSYSYAANGIDLVSMANTTSGGSQLLGTLTYNDKHEPLTVTGANGATATYEYNAQGQPTQFADALGNLTKLTYAGGYLKTAQGPLPGATYTFTYDIVGRIATVTDPAGSTVSYAYDAADRMTSATFPNGAAAKFAYHLLDLVKSTDRLGQATNLTYDADRELIKATDPLGQTTTLGYSIAGKLDSITDPNGHTTAISLDGQERMVAKQYADGTIQRLGYYRSLSLVSSMTDALAQTTQYAYNADNTPASITYVNPLQPTANVGFSYDPAYQRLVSMTDGIGTTTYSYYPVSSSPVLGANLLESVVSPIAGGVGTDTVTYSYDALNRIVGRSVNGATQATGFDALGRVSGTSNPLDAFKYSYSDATPRIAGVTSTQGPTAAMSYFGPTGDELLQQMTFTAQGGTPLSQFAYTYNADDNITTFTESYLNQNPAILAALGGKSTFTGALIGSVMKGGGGAAAPSQAEVHDSAAAISNSGVLATLMILGLSVVGCMAHGPSRRLRLFWALPPAAMMALAVGCGTDQGAAPTAVATGTATASVHRAKPPSAAQVTSYTYDTANRLSSALVSTTTGSLGTTPQFAYGYDRASNLTSITANEPAQSFTATATNGLTAGTYDANGNTTALSGRSFAWDGANRVVSFTSGTSKSRFYYDGMSRLVRVVDESQGRVVADHAYFWCGTDRCLAHDNTQAGSPVSAQYFAQGVIENDTPYYYVTDRLGSVRQLVNAGGDVVAQYDYDPYGNQAKISGAVSSDFGYAGYFEHAASGLDFAMYRAYDSNHARWLNRDPIAEAGGINLYEYVGDSPIARRDPTGLCDQKPCQWMTNNGNWTNSIVQGGIWAAAGVGGGLVAGGGVLSVPAGVGLGLIGFGAGFFGSFTYSWCL